MKKQLMTRKSLDGSISMVMSSGSQRISRYFPLLLAQELNYLPCKLLWLFSLSIIFAGLKLFLQLIVLIRRYLTIFSVAPLQHNLYIPSCTCWSILPLQPWCTIYCIGCHLCTHFRNCWIHCYLFLLSAGGDKLGMYCLHLMCMWPNWNSIFFNGSNVAFCLHLQVRNLLLTGCLFCGPLFLTFCFLNTVAIAYSATAALPFGTICVIVLIWTLVTFPLLVLGGIAGKNSKSEFQAPCRTTKYPREIPPLPWYRRTIPQMAMAGFLPFSAIYIELYYIFASVWGHRIYTIYSILFIVFIILLIVTAFITVALTYFQLAAEDHEWWWRYTIFL